MDEAMLAELMDRYLSGKTTAEEEAALEAWYRRQIGGEAEWIASDMNENESLHDEMFRIIQSEKNKRENETQQTEPVYLRPRRRISWLRAAAAVLLIGAVGTAIYLVKKKSAVEGIALNTPAMRDSIVPGSNGAVLTLANGKKVILDQAAVGSSLTTQNGTALKKTGDSLLVYQSGSNAGANAPVSYNILETPKGRQFSVVLPDGSRVWLNAASSLKYPTVFSGKERVVELSGEAYFEVVHNDRQSFKVKTAGQLIEDIGTHFNVNAYSDEKGVKTTLLEGAVRVSVSENEKPVLLRPGQQALSTGLRIRVSDADIKEAVSWKNGYFEFQHENIHTVMRQIARWYNVDVSYADDVPESYFTGDVDRNASISQALEILSFTGAHFTVSGHTITIKP